MHRSFVLCIALAATACASPQRPGTESPANPGASTAPASPPNTSLAANETPGLTPSSGQAAAAPAEAMPGMEHASDAGASSMAPGPSPASEPAPPEPRHVSAAASPAPPSANTDLAALEREAFDRAHPVFVRFCADCHTTQGARHAAARLRHFSMDGYPFGGHHAATIGRTIREVLGQAGEPATMPDDHPGAVQGADLALVLAWADAWDRLHNHSAPEGGRTTRHTEGAR